MMLKTASPSTTLFVVFGAAVKPDGTPSGTLKRRTLAALHHASSTEHGLLFLSGGQGQYGPPEAHVMRDLVLAHGGQEGGIILDAESHDTLASVIACTELIVSRDDIARVYVCSSPYHNIRCWLLLKLFGVTSQIAKMPSDRPSLGLWKWLFYYFRECVALPWDFLLALFDKRRQSLVRQLSARRAIH